MKTEKDFTKIVRLGTENTGGGRSYGVYCKIVYKDGNLSITGVEGPLRSGNCLGACGQIVMHLKAEDFTSFAPGWNKAKLLQFLDIWDKWHLNDMQPGCEHQRAAGWVNERIPPEELPGITANRDDKGILAIWVEPTEHPKGLLCKQCPVCGYQYGSKWLKVDVPADALDFLRNLPDTDKKPAWV